MCSRALLTRVHIRAYPRARPRRSDSERNDEAKTACRKWFVHSEPACNAHTQSLSSACCDARRAHCTGAFESDARLHARWHIARVRGRMRAKRGHASHFYIGHNYIGHDYIGHDYVGHDYIGHTYTCIRLRQYATSFAVQRTLQK